MLVVRSSRLQYLNIKIDVGFSTPKNKIKNLEEVRNFLGFFHRRPREEKKKKEEREREKRNKKRRQACAVEDQNASVT